MSHMYTRLASNSGANVVIQVLFYLLSFLIRQSIRNEHDYTWAQLETNQISNEPNWRWAMCTQCCIGHARIEHTIQNLCDEITY